MSLYPSHVLKLVECFKKLPGIGARSAEKLAFDLVNWQDSELKLFSSLLADFKEKVASCPECGCLKGPESCKFCAPEREATQSLCIVAYPKDVYPIEATHEFRGSYHVLEGTLSPLKGRGPDMLRFAPLMKRLENKPFQELVIALDSTVEGDATALYLKSILPSPRFQISRLAFGMPMDASIDYVDGQTLARAFKGRSLF